MKDQLEKSGCRILGAVLNRTGGGNSSGYYKKYYGKYYKKYDKYYENRSERGGDEVTLASAALETAMTAEPEQTEPKLFTEPEQEPEAELNGRKAGCSRKRKDRN